MNEYDVVIAGAGPVGLTLAIDLGQRGVRTLIVERDATTGPWPKMDRSNARTMEFYRRLGIADDVRAIGYPAEASMDVFIVSTLSEEPLLKLHYPSVESFRHRIAECPDNSQPLEPYQLVSQNRLEPLLKEVAEATPNVTVQYGCELINFTQDAEGVTVDCKLTSGDALQVRAKYLAGCDGGASAVRKQLGIELGGQGRLRNMRQICFRSEELYDRIPMGKGRHYYFTDPEGAAMIVQGDHKEFTIHADIPEKSDRDYEAWVREKVGPEINFDFELLNVTPWTLHLLLADRYQDQRVFLAGDAAHLVIPTGGLGMNSGVGDALDLSWKLAGTVHGWGGEGLLNSYEAERRPVGKRNVEASGWAAQGLGLWRSHVTDESNRKTPEGAALRVTTARAANKDHRRVHEMVGAELGYSYAGSKLIDGEVGIMVEWDIIRYVPSTVPGVRIPHIWLENGDAMQDVLGCEYSFLDLTGEGDTTSIEVAFSKVGAPLDIVSRDEAHVRAVYGCKYLLVRPDLHIVWTGNSMPENCSNIASMATGN